MQQISKAMQNNGFFLATVDTLVSVKGKKKEISYIIESEEPYTIRSYHTRFKQNILQKLSTSSRCLIHTGDRYNAEVLDAERTRISNAMRSTGYYYFSADLLHYVADSSLRQHKIDLTMSMTDNAEQAPDSIIDKIFTAYTIRRVSFVLDTLERESQPIREKSLRQNCYIKEGDIYNYHRVERTYSALNALPIIKYINIE